ncbi:hypothetical protein HPB47_007835, partial [Ixodes persulcatus]
MARGKCGRDVELWTRLTNQTATPDDDVPMTRCGRPPLGLGAAAMAADFTPGLADDRSPIPKPPQGNETKTRNLPEWSHDDTDDLENWAGHVLFAVHQQTSSVANMMDHSHGDFHLLEVREKCRKIIGRWKHHKHNKSLHHRIFELTQDSQEYADQLAVQHWSQLCEEKNGQLHTARVWQLFRSLMGQSKPRHAFQRYQVQRGCTTDELLRELQFALLQVRCNTNPGLDNVSYVILRKLPNYQEHLLRFNQQAWETGNIPSSCKEAPVILLPMPGHAPSTPGNLRPTSLTSRDGKVMDKMALERLEWHFTSHNQLPNTLIGFRRHAFDHVFYQTILHKLIHTQPGVRMIRYISDFITDLTIRIKGADGQLSKAYP